MGNLSQTFAAHRTPILVGGAGLVSAAGLYAHHKNAAAGAAASTATTTGAAAASPISGGASVASTDPYSGGVDTTGTDVYNALQPQLAQQQTLLSQLLDALKSNVPALPIPAKPKPAPVPVNHTGPIVSPVHPIRKPLPKSAPKGPTKKTPTRHVYTVVKGDNLSKIAARYHTTWSHLYALNKTVIGRNPNYILPGQRLVIP